MTYMAPRRQLTDSPFSAAPRRALGQKLLAELAQLPFAHAADPRELALVRRIFPRHLPQRDVRENDIRRHGLFVGEPLAQLAQPLEQRFVAGDFADLMCLRLR